MGRPISKTTKFILALPRTLSAAEVLKKAKASGLKTSESNVHRVRRLHGGSKGAAKKPAHAGGATKTAASAPRSTSLTKSDFVRSLGAAMPAKEVVAKGKAAGLTIDLQYVYKVRSRPEPGRGGRPVARPAATVAARTNGSHTRAEDLLRAVAAELGLGYALEILERQRAQVRAMIGG